jgi:sugar phosphate isomerase/epimerase
MISSMRPAVITDELSDDLGVALAECVRLGIGVVELRSVSGRNVVDFDDRELDEAIRAVRSHELAIAALATPVFKCALPGDEMAAPGALHGARAMAGLDEHWRMLDRAAELAARHGVPYIRVFSFWRVANPEAAFDVVAATLAAALRRIAGRPVELLLENEHDCNVATAAETLAALDAVPGLRVIWDPGNHVRAGGDPRDAAPIGFADRVAHVHLKDVGLEGQWVPLTQGRVPIDSVLAVLEDAGYEGALSLETHSEIDGSMMRATEYSLEALAELLEGRLEAVS